MNLFSVLIPAPLLPDHVYASAYTFNATLHRPHTIGPLNIGRAACGWLNTAALTRPTTEMARYQPVWCAKCWPLRRCAVCGAPSGGQTECHTCTTIAISVEADLDRAAEYREHDQDDDQ